MIWSAANQYIMGWPSHFQISTAITVQSARSGLPRKSMGRLVSPSVCSALFSGPLNGLTINVIMIPMMAAVVTTGRKNMVRKKGDILSDASLRMIAKIKANVSLIGMLTNMNLKERKNAFQKYSSRRTS